jgi:DNA-binding NarL/FixJ family response regulator
MPDEAAVRVHLADDHTMFREGLESILASREGIEVVGTSSTGPEAAERVATTRPDVVVTQLDMQLKTAQEIISGLREASPGSRIVVLTLWDNLRYLQAISKMGIDAFLHKSSSAKDLVATLGAVSRDPGGGNVVISMPRGLLELLGDEPAGSLSERETEVVVLAARGLSNRTIARELHLAEATVKRHLANIYQKIGVRSRNEAVRTAITEQWIGIHEITSADGDGPPDGRGG